MIEAQEIWWTNKNWQLLSNCKYNITEKCLKIRANLWSKYKIRTKVVSSKTCFITFNCTSFGSWS